MPIPAVKGYMPLCVTPRSLVCDEQGIGQWPMWQRFDSVKAIVNQYIEEPYRDFLAFPYHEVDKMKSEEVFYWYTPRCDTSFTRLSQSGDDHIYYKQLLDETLSHYHTVIDKLKSEGKSEEANFLQLSLKYAGESEDSVYCGNGRVVATVWGMRPRDGYQIGDSIIEKDIFPPAEMHSVRYDIGEHGTTGNPVLLKKSHGSSIFAEQVPQVSAVDGYEFTGWDSNPVGAIVNDDLLFTASYRKIPTNAPFKQDEPLINHHIRFISPEGQIIKELNVEHGKQIPNDAIPPLPTVNNVVCSSWDGDPLNDIIIADRDYKAISPAKPKVQLHKVRFLSPSGDELRKFDVEHGTRLTQEQVPPLPVIDGEACLGWNVNPLEKEINSDTDFVAKLPEKKKLFMAGNGGCLSALLKWLLLLLGLLLILLLLWCFIFDKCYIDLCGCNCDNVERTVIVKPEPIINDGDKLPEPTQNCGVHFSGLILSDVPSEDGIAVIFGNDPMGEYVGSGFYPDNSKAFPNAVQYTFDAIAVDKGTRLIIYREPNFKGDVLLDIVGPALITNVMWKDDLRYNQVANKVFSSDLQALFPPSKRQWSSENMHDWSYGSCKIICQQCE